MKNIFAKFQEYVKKPKRNVFDMSFRNNLTLKFGELTPVFCKEVIPGDSFKIDTKFGLMMMPMKFPVQTPMKAYIHYFYVRNRTTWKDWQDFIGGTKDGLVLPYVQPVDKKKFFRVGGLADYLGVPNINYGEYGNSFDGEFSGFSSSYSEVIAPNTNPYDISVSYNPIRSTGKVVNGTFLPWISASVYDAIYKRDAFISEAAENIVENNTLLSASKSDLFEDVSESRSVFVNNMRTNIQRSNTEEPSAWNDVKMCPFFVVFEYESQSVLPVTPLTLEFDVNAPDNIWTDDLLSTPYSSFFAIFFDSENICLGMKHVPLLVTNEDSEFKYHYLGQIEEIPEGTQSFVLVNNGFSHFQEGNQTHDLSVVAHINGVSGTNFNISDFTASISASGGVKVIGDGVLTETPYDSSIHLSALPFRAYEAIYNAYYRNPQNNPFILDGVAEYNRYNTTYDGGADYTQYDLFFRNWEYDFLTSAVQSPQQGVAPLVGMSVTGEATFQDEEGNTYYAQAILNDEGEITGWQSHSSNMPVGSLRLLMDMAGTGISINDLRNVNAFQRFLENNIRHGLKYKDQIMSHFGVKVRYDELDMPEFIGGVSAEIDVYKVTQTSNSGDTPMGSFVGQAQVLKSSGHSVTHYCDEHGYILGIMSVVPVPVYSQLLPKHFIKFNQLDFFFPEFGHIGYQPITQKEVSPIQTFYAGHDLNKVFGYNRAWYDYLASTDEVHSQFRTTMRDFLMNRTFDTEPELSESFLLVDPNQLNDVFLAGTDDDDLYAPDADKIIGSILFNVSAKRPIPLFGIPKLEG